MLDATHQFAINSPALDLRCQSRNTVHVLVNLVFAAASKSPAPGNNICRPLSLSPNSSPSPSLLLSTSSTQLPRIRPLFFLLLTFAPLDVVIQSIARFLFLRERLLRSANTSSTRHRKRHKFFSSLPSVAATNFPPKLRLLPSLPSSPSPSLALSLFLSPSPTHRLPLKRHQPSSNRQVASNLIFRVCLFIEERDVLSVPHPFNHHRYMQHLPVCLVLLFPAQSKGLSTRVVLPRRPTCALQVHRQNHHVFRAWLPLV
jgi:hypothetical protein